MPYIINNVREYDTNSFYLQLYLWQSDGMWKLIMLTESLDGITPEGDTLIIEHIDTVDKGVEEILNRYDCNMSKGYKVIYFGASLSQYSEELYKATLKNIDKIGNTERG